MLGNEDMFDKSGTPAINKGQGTKWQRMQLGGIAGGVALSNVTRPPSMYGMNQLILDEILQIKRRKVRAKSRVKMLSKIENDLKSNQRALATSKAAATNKYSLIRAAMVRDCETMLRVYTRFGGTCNGQKK
jgi:hypothetical protein